jgi:hypothetical protein
LLATAIASLLLVGALALRMPLAIPVALVVLAAPYVALLGFEHESLDARAPVIAALLLAIAELAYWSLELRGALADEPGTYLRRVSLLSLLVLGTIVGGSAILALVAEVSGGGTALDLLGAAAALGAVALLAFAATRRTVP